MTQPHKMNQNSQQKDAFSRNLVYYNIKGFLYSASPGWSCLLKQSVYIFCDVTIYMYDIGDYNMAMNK